MFPKIHIYLDQHQFTFENQKNEVFTLKTVVYITQVKGRWMVLGFDHWENKPPEVSVINLFENHTPLPTELNKIGLLSMFLEYGIGKSIQSSIIPVLRPIVILHGINNFSDILSGYEKSFFGNVVISASASKVILDSGTTIGKRNVDFNKSISFSK